MTHKALKGRGAVSNPDNRYHQQQREDFDDGWETIEEQRPSFRTKVHIDKSKTIITTNKSPDVPFEQSVNPYRGCEHGCIYCFARPTHAYLDFSPGLDFETQIVIKPEAPALLRKELARKSYQCKIMAMGTNTDPYQPLEREQRITRSILQILYEYRHPLAIVSKSSLIERDIDILSAMAGANLIQVMISITSFDKQIVRTLEPRASSSQRRLQTIETLANAGIPVGVLVAPVIPVLTDAEMENILQQAYAMGARHAGYVLLRLPLEVAPLFEEWLRTHYPLKADHVMTRVRDTRGGAVYQHQFAQRMRGSGEYAAIIERRFVAACRKYGYTDRHLMLDTSAFRAPKHGDSQLSLF